MMKRGIIILLIAVIFAGCSTAPTDEQGEQSVKDREGQDLAPQDQANTALHSSAKAGEASKIPASGNWSVTMPGSAVTRPIPEEARLLYNQGNEAFTSGDLGTAAKLFSHAISLYPTFAEAFDNRGITYRRLGQFDKAIADHSKAIQLNPQLGDAYDNRALAFSAMQRYKAVNDNYPSPSATIKSH